MTFSSVGEILEATGGPDTRRVLILTALPLEMVAVRLHLTPVASTNALDGTVFECGTFSEGAEALLVVVAETGAGNTDAEAVALRAHDHFGGFDAQLFVGVGGSRKRDAPVGSVVASSQVYWPYGGKHDADGRSARPRAFPSHARLVGLARKVCRDSEWQARIPDRAEGGAESQDGALGNHRPLALVAPIVSVEAVQADRDSGLEALIAASYGDAHVVEMEGYGAQSAAHRSDIPSIVVRGISDLTHHDKSPDDDGERQPLAARNAAAFAFELLHQWTLAFAVSDPDASLSPAQVVAEAAVLQDVDAQPAPDPDYREAVRAQLDAASAELLSWPAALPDGEQIERPELDQLLARIEGSASTTTAVTGDPGAGKSALLATLTHRFMERDWPVLAIKGDLLAATVSTESMLQEHLDLEALPSVVLRRLATRQPVLLVFDQLDALAAYLDLKTERLNVLLNLVQRLGGAENVHIVLSSRTFEFHHDVRLRTVSTEELPLHLPPREEVLALLEARGVRAAGWPADAQEVMRSPQALATYLALMGEGPLDAFSSYHDMLEHLWTKRILLSDEGARRGLLATDIARAMAREESLWLPLVRFEEQLDDILALEAAGVLLRRKGSVGFTHQTVFEHVLARGFAGGQGELTRYVLARQDSLFVRPKMWVGLNYLRGVAPNTYRQEFETIWREPDLRDHLRLLLIDFLGRQSDPTDPEALLMAEALGAPNHHRFQAYRAISGSSGWFRRFGETFIADAMLESSRTEDAVTGVLVRAWAFAPDEVVALLGEHWLPERHHDERAWWVLQNAPHWSQDALATACTIVERTEIAPHLMEHVVAFVGVDQPDAALQIVRARLVRDLHAARAETVKRTGRPKPEFRSLDEDVAWHMKNDPRRPLKELVDTSQGWESLPALASRAPALFLEMLWPWFEEYFLALGATRETHREHVNYPLGMDAVFRFEQESAMGHSEPALLEALRTATERLAETDPDTWLSWAGRIGAFEAVPAQRLVAHVFSLSPARFASHALAFLLADSRRLLLGATLGTTTTTERLVANACPHWSADEFAAFERAVGEYRPATPDDLTEPEQRRAWNTTLRLTRLGLLRAVPNDLLTAGARRQVEEEDRAFPYARRGVRFVGPHWVGPVMDATAISKASDADIVNAFRALPDASGWDHPRRPGIGGNIQLARAFAEFSTEHPERAMRLLGELHPENGTRAAALALESISKAAEPGLVLALLHDVVGRGFDDEEFRSYASRAVRQLVERKAQIDDRTIALLESWLAQPSPDGAADDGGGGGEEPEAADGAGEDEHDCTQRSLLWALGGHSLVPGGSYPVLEVLVFIRRAREEYDQLDEMLERHLDRCKRSEIWEHVLCFLPSPHPRSHQREAELVRRLFAEVPSLVGSRPGAQLLAKSHSWNEDLARSELGRWRDLARRPRRFSCNPVSLRSSNSLELSPVRRFLDGVVALWTAVSRGIPPLRLFNRSDAFAPGPAVRQAYGEIVAICAISRPDLTWANEWLDELFRDKALDDARAGAALTAAQYWIHRQFRSRAGDLLTRLLAFDELEVWRAACEVFRLADSLPPGPATVALLSAMEQRPGRIPRSHASFVAQRMGMLLPHEALLVARVAQGLIRAWRESLPDTTTSTALAAPELIDLALTLHRLGPETQQIGTDLFEQLIENDAWEARQVLDEIDNRFLERAPRPRRLPRRRPRRRRP